MERAGIIIMALISFAFGLMMVANVIPSALHDTLSEEYSENYSVITGPGTTTAVATLTYDHYYEDLRDLTLESTLATDNPAVMTYTVATKEVGVAGLTVSGTRILSIDYVRETDNSMFTGWSTFVTVIPFLIGLGLIVMLVRSFWSSR